MRSSKCRSIVEPVTDHQNAAACSLQLLYTPNLGLRQHAVPTFVNPERGANLGDFVGEVAGEHFCRQSHEMKLPYGCCRIGTDLVRDREPTDRPAVLR